MPAGPRGGDSGGAALLNPKFTESFIEKVTGEQRPEELRETLGILGKEISRQREQWVRKQAQHVPETSRGRALLCGWRK